MGRLSGMSLFFLGVLAMGFITQQAHAQGLYKISTEEKISRSSLIVEGKVINQRSYWDEAHRMIYTSNEVEVYKIFKGTTEKNTIEVVTVGGAVDNYYIHASHQLELSPNDIGIFFCNKTKNNRFDVYSSMQGFLKYDLRTKKAIAPFVEFNDIENVLYPELNNKIRERIQVKNPSFSVSKINKQLEFENHSILAPSISSFSPASVYGGALMDPANNILTINGSGFGNRINNAAVLFQSADANPGTFVTLDTNNTLIISWTDTQIRVRVPGNAGTGIFRVQDASGSFVESATPLQVVFTVLTANFGGSYGYKQFNLGNRNGSGGYNVKYSTNTANNGVNINTSPAKETFQRALKTWVDQVGLNFTEAGTSTLQSINPDDNENIIMFDNSGTGLSPLAAGVLATCFSGITICTNDPTGNQAIKTGFDIVIRNTGYSTGSTPLTFGPCPPYSSTSSVVDLETVLLHELGHALNLGHVVDNLEGAGNGTINPPKVMNFSLTINQRRISLDHSSKLGAAYQVNPPSVYQIGTCLGSSPLFVSLPSSSEPKDECPSDFPTTTTPIFTTENFNLSLASSNKFADPGFEQWRTDGVGTSVTNTAFYALRTNKTGGNLAIEVDNYTTNPSAIAACTIGNTGVEVTGVKLSIYKVNSCPEGGVYPEPIVYTTFNQDGNLPLVSGLSASTNYLVVLDGIQNTKAIFDLIFSGTALLERVTDLNGQVFGSYNFLNWTTDTVFNIASMTLERSSDGITYVPVSDIVGEENQGLGEYTDNNPLPGTNYYRLAIEDINGSTDYSDVVVLTRSEELVLAVKSNPVKTDNIVLNIVNNDQNNYTFLLRNSFGQTLSVRQMQLTGGHQNVIFPIPGLQNGVYYITVLTTNNSKRIKTLKVIVMKR